MPATQEEFKPQIHCSECNRSIPENLLLEPFAKIISSPAIYKLLITSKQIGKSTNLILFQIWYILYHKIANGKFYWIFRYKDDKLDKGKYKWLEAIDEIMPTKDIEKFNEKDWDVSGRGITYKGKLRVIFTALQDFKSTDSAFGRNAIHLVFEEAMPSDNKQLENPNEETRWGQILANVMKKTDKPTECYFLCNPHTKGMWFLERFCKQEWIAEAFAEDEKEHFYEGEVIVESKGQPKPVLILLFQAPEKEDENTFMLNMVNNPLRRPKGTFSPEANRYINLSYFRGNAFPKNWKQLYLVKDCIYARELKQRAEIHQKFWYKKGEEEEVDKNILHLCLSAEEYSASNFKRKKLIDSSQERDYWIKDKFYYGLTKKRLPAFFTGIQAYQARDIITNLIYANIKNFDKSS